MNRTGLIHFFWIYCPVRLVPLLSGHNTKIAFLNVFTTFSSAPPMSILAQKPSPKSNSLLQVVIEAGAWQLRHFLAFLLRAVHRVIRNQALCPSRIERKGEEYNPNRGGRQNFHFVDEVVCFIVPRWSAHSTLHGRLFGKQVHHLAHRGGTSVTESILPVLAEFSPACSYWTKDLRFAGRPKPVVSNTPVVWHRSDTSNLFPK